MIEQEDLDDLKENIKQGMPEWLATMKRYEDEEVTDLGEVWGL